MRNQSNCTELCLNRDSVSLGAFIGVREKRTSKAPAALTPGQELRAARLQGIQAGAGEQVVWLWLAGSALATLALSFLA